MSSPELNNLNDYERFVSTTIKPWTREQRIALTASMAERWLPVYESFCEDEEWGDPEAFKQAVQSVWSCVLGHKLTSKEHRQHQNLVEENTPHMDDFDAEEAIATSGIIYYALKSCMSTDNTEDAVMAMVSGFEAVAPGIYSDEDEVPEEAWSQIRDLLKKELKPRLDNAPPADQQKADELRQKMMSTRFVTQDGVGPLPPDVWDAAGLNDHVENMLKLPQALSDLGPLIAQQLESFKQQSGKQQSGSSDTDSKAEQASQSLWQLPQVQNELEKQLKLIRLIGDMTNIDRQQIDALRQKLTSPKLAGSPLPRH